MRFHNLKWRKYKVIKIILNVAVERSTSTITEPTPIYTYIFLNKYLLTYSTKFS